MSDEVVVRRVDAGNPKEQNAMIDLTRRAFFNQFEPGADEHYLLHLLQSHPDHIPDLYFAAFLDNEPAGCIAFTRSSVSHDDGTLTETCTFGPVCTRPDLQGRGIARKLISHSLDAARDLGFKACIIFGDPRFYWRLGFRCAERYDIADEDGYFQVAMMAREIQPGSLRAGTFRDSGVFRSLERAEEWDRERGAEMWDKVEGRPSQLDFKLLSSLCYKRT
ncbi:acyl-CoA N-acyltransferase [Zopfochytrium polystomum]|nr:acyl-CoA N-acyltransferase [Zopfochytrium polystomum]